MSPHSTPEPQPALANALACARAGDVAAAIALVRGVAGRGAPDSERAEACRVLGEIASIAESEGDLAGAERALAAATALCPEYADVQVRHARVLTRLGDRRAARRAIDRALQRHPRFVEARLERALLDARDGLVGEALSALRALSRETAIEEPQAFDQGMQCLERADWESGESLLRRALSVVEPGFGEALSEIRERLTRGEADRAAELLHRLLDRHPAYPDLHALLGEAELALARPEDAIDSLARALELNPDFHDARVLLSRALEALGAYASAADQVALVLERDPRHPGALEIESRRSASARARAAS